MNVVLPQNFLELLGGFLILIAVVLSVISMVPKLRSSALRLSAINFLAALALFSNYWATYFAAIFIIATAVTELEFLHILAAIIRGDKNYFDFRREFLTHDEALRKARQDEVTDPSVAKQESEERVASTLTPTGSRRFHNQTAIRALQVEERALEWLEKEFSLTVQRYVRFTNREYIVEVDGIIQGKRGEPDTLIEVKWVRNEPPGTGVFGRIIDQVSNLSRRYKEVTKRNAEMILLLVVPSALPRQVVTQTTERLYERGVKNKVVFVTYSQLDLPGSDNSDATPAA